MQTVADQLAGVVGADRVLTGGAIGEQYAHDEALTAAPHAPDVVVRPVSTEQVAAVVRLAGTLGVPVTARGAGTGLAGGCVPRRGGIVMSFEDMASIVEIDTENHVAVVQPGVTLARLDEESARHGLVYPVFPGENSATLGGTVATNAGGMRAVRYGVTRHQVLGVEAVLGTGEVIRTGGRCVKATTGYDLTQLIVGSEGTLALVTEATLRLYPRPAHTATVLAPFGSVDQVAAAVPPILVSGIVPTVLEYVDALSMAAITADAGAELGIPRSVLEGTLAYLVVVVEERSAERLEGTVEELGHLIGELGAVDVYVLPPRAAGALIEARERAFWTAKARGAHDIVDVVVPPAQMPDYLAQVGRLAERTGSFVVGCGHAGDGNVHLSVFQADADRRHEVLHAIFELGMGFGGAISGEHGVGSEKLRCFLELEDPAKIALMRRVKAAFDPLGILNPGAIFDGPAGAAASPDRGQGLSGAPA